MTVASGREYGASLRDETRPSKRSVPGRATTLPGTHLTFYRRGQGFLCRRPPSTMSMFPAVRNDLGRGGGPGSADPILPKSQTSSRSHSRGASRTSRGSSRGRCRSHRSRRSHHIHRRGGSVRRSRHSSNHSSNRSRSYGRACGSDCGSGGSAGGSRSRNQRSPCSHSSGPERSSWEQRPGHSS